jgi:hypothetical protein
VPSQRDFRCWYGAFVFLGAPQFGYSVSYSLATAENAGRFDLPSFGNKPTQGGLLFLGQPELRPAQTTPDNVSRRDFFYALKGISAVMYS